MFRSSFFTVLLFRLFKIAAAAASIHTAQRRRVETVEFRRVGVGSVNAA